MVTRFVVRQIVSGRRLLGRFESRILVHLGAVGHAVYYSMEYVESHGPARAVVSSLFLMAMVEVLAIRDDSKEG